MNNNKFETAVVNLCDLHKMHFNIPTYQRPYVWGDEQIEKLLGDFYKSYHFNPNQDYYIGTILTKDRGYESELIDGQQRFTTLWLTAFIFSMKNKSSKIEEFLKNENATLKMNFEIRTEVEDYFFKLLEKDKDEGIKIIESHEIAKFPYLKNIAKALVTINSIIDSIPENELKPFGDFIYQKVYMIKNSTPEKIDLNKLFSTVNSAGIQLEQTDIVKANLLKLIDDKVLFSKIWESCENMNNFFERNVRNSFPITDWHAINLCNFIEFDKSIFLYDKQIQDVSDETDNQLFVIDNLPNESIDLYVENKKEASDEKRESEEIYCRSIINFGQLLLHTYRLHLKSEDLADFEGTFHVNRLIEIFKELEKRNNSEEIKRFFLLLWKVRFLFDKYIIKWISDVDTKTENLELLNCNKNAESYYSRTKYVKSNISMLQSVLYFTGDYLRQFWLTSYLGFLVKNHNNLDANSDFLLNKLENIDNSLSLCKTKTDKVATWELIDSEIEKDFDFIQYLQSNLGTKFQHYWFQKLEYVLWKNWEFEKTKEFENFRIMSKNSVEHIYPQNPENKIKHPELEKKYLDCFGNLVLLSVSQNSEYSNKSVDEKRSMFINRSNTYDTLKSYYIFIQNPPWTIDKIEEHQREMIDKIKEHYSKI